MDRAKEILALVDSEDEWYSDAWRSDLLDWLGDREDEELVELMRGAAITLAYRMVTHNDTRSLKPGATPSPEVIMTALANLTEAFHVDVKESL